MPKPLSPGRARKAARKAERRARLAALHAELEREWRLARLTQMYPHLDFEWTGTEYEPTAPQPPTPGTRAVLEREPPCLQCGAPAIVVHYPATSSLVIKCEHCGYHKVSKVSPVEADAVVTGPA